MASPQLTRAAINLLVCLMAERRDDRIVDNETAGVFAGQSDDLISKLLKEVVDEEERPIIVVGNGTFGIAIGQSSALRNYIAAGGDTQEMDSQFEDEPEADNYVMYSCPPGSSVGDMGGIIHSTSAVALGCKPPYEIERCENGEITYPTA